ncbi:MAG: protein kinase, partial [Pyrinomonadaceae bacterium]
MGIALGTHLGRYEIVSLIGAGGMGEVYRAKDPKLGRDVAIKVLPAEFSADTERLRRFEQEAQAAGTLNHPNILAIYDVATHDGSLYVVSELLEGETLRERQNGTALPARKSIDYALQITHGLAAAHEKGIIHRDLKPENLFITKDGRVKILDFGLAKLIEPTSENGARTDVPTRIINTDPGAVMGTAGYMSPEQLRGAAVDPRTDIFSFGAVFYEMLSGRRAFRGDSAADMISSILKEDPSELSETNENINPGIDRVVRRCLEKNREERFHSASDLAFALESLSGTQASGSTMMAAGFATAELSPPGVRRTLLDRLAWIAAGLFLVSTVVLAAVYLRRAEPGRETMRFSLPFPEKTTFGEAHALAPDGRRLVFVAVGTTGSTSLWVRSFDSTADRELQGTEDAALPFWSPDSRFIGFFAGNKLKKIDASGGPAQTVTDASAEARGGAWGADGVILFTPSFTTPLYKVSASGGGAAMPATEFDQSRQQTSHRWPSFLPDGRRFLYFSRSTQKQEEGIYVGSLDSNESKFLLNTSLLAVFAPAVPGGTTGHLLYVRDKSLVAQPFDTGRLELSGEPAVIAEGVMNIPGESGPTAFAAFSVSSNGNLSYLTGKEPLTQMSWVDRAGRSSEPLVPPGDYSEPWLSPDGKRIVFGRGGTQDQDHDIWMLDATRGTMSRFTFDPGTDVCPVWSPDGSRIVFSANRNGKQELYQKLSGGTGAAELLVATGYNAYPDDWTTTAKGGEFILYEMENPTTKFDLYVLPLFGDRKPIPFIQTEFNEGHAQFSPDGRFVAYASDESGRVEVYVQSFPGPGGKWQVSAAGGDQPQWRDDGRELFYMTPDKKLTAVAVTPGAAFEAGAALALFTTRIPTTQVIEDRNNFLAAPDGQRFLVNNLVEEGNTQPIT